MSYPTNLYLLTFEERPTYLYAKLTGENMTPDIALAYLRELSDKRAEIDAECTLLDRQVPVVMSNTENYLVLMEMIEIFGRHKLAIVNRVITDKEILEFGRQASEHWGMPYRTFLEMDDAEKWLLQ